MNQIARIDFRFCEPSALVLINILRKRISRDELRRNLKKQTVVATFARTWL